MHSFKLMVFVVLISSQMSLLNAQKMVPCKLTTNVGTTIDGYIKKYGLGYDLSRGFKLYNDKKQKIKIVPSFYKKIEVADDIYYSKQNSKSDICFMKQLFVGDKASLYLNLYRVTTSEPGFGTSSWREKDYYLEQGETWLYLDRNEVLKNPEVFFKNAPELCEKIRNTSNKEIDFLQWIKEYDELP